MCGFKANMLYPHSERRHKLVDSQQLSRCRKNLETWHSIVLHPGLLSLDPRVLPREEKQEFTENRPELHRIQRGHEVLASLFDWNDLASRGHQQIQARKPKRQDFCRFIETCPRHAILEIIKHAYHIRERLQDQPRPENP